MSVGFDTIEMNHPSNYLFLYILSQNILKNVTSFIAIHFLLNFYSRLLDQYARLKNCNKLS